MTSSRYGVGSAKRLVHEGRARRKKCRWARNRILDWGEHYLNSTHKNCCLFNRRLNVALSSSQTIYFDYPQERIQVFNLNS